MELNKTIVSRRVAELLSIKGFDEATQNYYVDKLRLTSKRTFNRVKHNRIPSHYAAPTIDELVSWLKDKHNIICRSTIDFQDILNDSSDKSFKPYIEKDGYAVNIDWDYYNWNYLKGSYSKEKDCYNDMFEYILKKFIPNVY